MIKVLIVDDSHTTMEYLKYLLDSNDEIMIVGIAENGYEAVELSKKKHPDVILMDINMPGMNGFQATRIIMENNPVPIIIMSATHDVKNTDVIFKAMEAGAATLTNKPMGIDHPHHERDAKELLLNVKLMSEVKVVRRYKSIRVEERGPKPKSPALKLVNKTGKTEVIAIGASAGGPPVLRTILSKISKDFPTPILIVQHISKGFLDGLTEWLSTDTDCPIHIATDREILLPGHVYFAPDNYHMGVSDSRRIVLSKTEPENNNCPSISFLFRSVAEVYGAQATGVLLTGMGKDGADNLKLMRDKGAVTIVQDKESSLVYGMPGEAIKLDAATYELPANSIADALLTLAEKNNQPNEHPISKRRHEV